MGVVLRRGLEHWVDIILIMCVHALAHVSISSPEDQKKASDPLDLELLVVLRHPVWVLGTKLGFSLNL